MSALKLAESAEYKFFTYYSTQFFFFPLSCDFLVQVMCVQYWPASKDKDEEYGGIGVSVLKEEELANFHIRTIRLYKKNENDVSALLSRVFNFYVINARARTGCM